MRRHPGGGPRRPGSSRRRRGARPCNPRTPWVEPRLAHLLVWRAPSPPADPQDLLGAWRLLRAAERAASDRTGVRGPAVGRLRCWTSSTTCWTGPRYPLFVLTWPARAGRAAARLGRRRARSYLADLEPLPRRPCERAAGWAGARAAGRAAGRSLEPAEGAAVCGGDGADAAGPGAAGPGRRRVPVAAPIEALGVPETLHALIAAGWTA